MPCEPSDGSSDTFDKIHTNAVLSTLSRCRVSSLAHPNPNLQPPLLVCSHLLSNGKPDALALGQRHERLLARANHKHVCEAGGKLVANRVLDGDNVNATVVAV